MLHQQGTQRIEIIVRKEGGAGETGARETPTDEIGGDAENQKSSFWFGNASPQRRKRIIKTNATHLLAVTKQVTDLVLEFEVSGLGYKNGDQAYQDQVARQVEIVKDVTNVASSIGMGALYGSWGGPIGAVAGMLLGALSTGASTGVKYAGRGREFNYKVFKENNSIEYQRARASISLTTGRLR